MPWHPAVSCRGSAGPGPPAPQSPPSCPPELCTLSHCEEPMRVLSIEGQPRLSWPLSYLRRGPDTALLGIPIRFTGFKTMTRSLHLGTTPTSQCKAVVPWGREARAAHVSTTPSSLVSEGKPVTQTGRNMGVKREGTVPPVSPCQKPPHGLTRWPSSFSESRVYAGFLESSSSPTQ